MSKKEDVEFLKMYFKEFGEELVQRLETTYDKKGMSFSNANLERLCVKLMEETGEVAKEIFSGKSVDDLLYEIIDVANMSLLMYINAKEVKVKHNV